MRNAHRILSILLISFIFIGCTNTNKNQGVSSKNAEINKSSTKQETATNSVQGIKLVKKQTKTKYLLSNGIEFKYEENSVSTSLGEVKINFPQISGLVNKELQKKLNATIYTDITAEIKNYVSETNVLPQYLVCTVLLNANNLLSISLNDLYSPPLCGFLYRLTDGKRLYLKDIFTEGTDYVPLLNQKVIEGIVGGESEEEDILEKPFSTIKPDQDFALSGSSLYMIFRAGESGFEKRSSVEVPLSSIDDYVNVTDIYSGTERKTQENADLIVRMNNIFFTPKGQIIKRENGNVWTYYPEISGLRDDNFEKTINNIIVTSASKAANDEALKSLKKAATIQFEGHIAEVHMDAAFNHYGLLTIVRNVYCDDMNQYENLKPLISVYTFDLAKKKCIDPKTILIYYLNKNKNLQDIFAKMIKENLKSQNPSLTNKFTDEINSKFDYTFIINSSTIYFEKYGDVKNDIYIVINYKENTLEGISQWIECRIPLKNIYSGQPEDFFGW